MSHLLNKIAKTILSMSSSLFLISVQAQPVIITITNQVLLPDGSTPDLKQVQIRVGAGNNWTPLPNLSTGVNQVTVEGPQNSSNGIFRARFPDGKLYAGIFAVDGGDRAQFSLSAPNTEPVQMQSHLVLSKEFSTPQMALSSVSATSNTWHADCNIPTEATGTLNCDIDSIPKIRLTGETTGQFITRNNHHYMFTTDAFTPQQLLDTTNISFEGGAYYTHERIDINDGYHSFIGAVGYGATGRLSSTNAKYVK